MVVRKVGDTCLWMVMIQIRGLGVASCEVLEEELGQMWLEGGWRGG
jgi:hypothetical protein